MVYNSSQYAELRASGILLGKSYIGILVFIISVGSTQFYTKILNTNYVPKYWYNYLFQFIHFVLHNFSLELQ